MAHARKIEWKQTEATREARGDADQGRAIYERIPVTWFDTPAIQLRYII
jgi:hypothetical protein